jgi:FAD/FMN-containing dehydrogenase
VSFQPTYSHTPETEQQIYEILKYAAANNENVKVVGSGCSYTEVQMRLAGSLNSSLLALTAILLAWPDLTDLCK